jgi:hypothetical protein
VYIGAFYNTKVPSSCLHACLYGEMNWWLCHGD